MAVGRVNAVRWMPSRTHHGLTGLKASWPTASPIAPIQQSARSLQTCAAAWIGMKLKRKLTWDVTVGEMFTNDDAANALRGRKSRKPEYDTEI